MVCAGGFEDEMRYTDSTTGMAHPTKSGSGPLPGYCPTFGKFCRLVPFLEDLSDLVFGLIQREDPRGALGLRPHSF